jgi:hypothetical protein
VPAGVCTLPRLVVGNLDSGARRIAATGRPGWRVTRLRDDVAFPGSLAPRVRVLGAFLSMLMAPS